MSRLKLPFNANLIGLLIVVVAFAISLGRVIRTASEQRSAETGKGKKIIRVMHWQLEPGFREGIDAVIDDYMQLPHVKAANVEIRQLAIPQKVYPQFINVHLISGTAPDICFGGSAEMTSQGRIGQFFIPLGKYVEQPNPYNGETYLPEDMEERLKAFLSESPWRDTFIDGMYTGWSHELKNYYSIPTASWGSMRVFYNRRLMREAKQLLREGFAQEPLPTWITDNFLRKENGEVAGYLHDTHELRAWVADDTIPETFGRLMLMCSAIREYARVHNRDKLVPVAGHNRSVDVFVSAYLPSFTSSYVKDVDVDFDLNIGQLDTVDGYYRSEWSFEDRQVKSFYECLRAFFDQFPQGFQGLDRDQSNRRFVLGNAAMIATGGWDAASIFRGAAAEKEEIDPFQVGIMRFPMPGPGERWRDAYLGQMTESDIRLGVSLMVNKTSPHRDWAVDFLRYLTSMRGNEKFNKISGWVPCIIGAEPRKEMEPFMPVMEGIRPTKLQFTDSVGHIATVYKGQRWLYFSGDVTYEQFSQNIEDAILAPRTGALRLWYDKDQEAEEGAKGFVQRLLINEFEAFYLGDETARSRYDTILIENAANNNGSNRNAQFHKLHPDEPFPEF